MKTLVSFSGGIDSTYAIWKLLTTTSDEVTAVFFDMVVETNTPIGDWQALPYWKHAAEQIIDWFNLNIRPVTFIVHPFYTIPQGETILTLAAKWAASQVNENTYDKFFWCGDLIGDGRGTSFLLPILFDEVATPLKRGKFFIPYQIWDQSTANAVQLLPAPLLAITASCLKPKEQIDDLMVPCGKCMKCTRTLLMKSLLETGMSASDVNIAWINTPSRATDKNAFKINFENNILSHLPVHIRTQVENKRNAVRVIPGTQRFISGTGIVPK